MEKKNYNEYTEDELKELQRKEALSDSEEYDDISDDTYNDGPVIRQFVENEKIAGGAALDDDDDLLSSGTACDNQGSNMIDDLPDIDLISDPEDNTDPDPISDPEDTQNQETEPNPEVVDAEDPISADKPGFQNESLIDEQERDYCDRESALQPMEEPELPDTKSLSLTICLENGMVVFTPSTINSSSARRQRMIACSRSGALTINLAIMLS